MSTAEPTPPNNGHHDRANKEYYDRLSYGVGHGIAKWKPSFLENATVDKRFYVSQALIANTRLLCCFTPTPRNRMLNCYGVRLKFALMECENEMIRCRNASTSRTARISSPPPEVGPPLPGRLRYDQDLVQAVASNTADQVQKCQFGYKMQFEAAFRNQILLQMETFMSQGQVAPQFNLRAMMMTPLPAQTGGNKISFDLGLLNTLIDGGGIPNLEHPDLPVAYVQQRKAARGSAVSNGGRRAGPGANFGPRTSTIRRG